MDRKGRAGGMNTSIVTILGSNVDISFAITVDQFKLSVEDMV